MSQRYPKRDKKHIIDEQGQNILKGVLPNEWHIMFYQSREYGTDFEVEIPGDDQMMANIFKGQLKSHQKITINKNSTISQYIYYKNWNNWQRQSSPFFLVIVDIKINKCYWLNIKTTSLEIKKDKAGITIQIPIRNDLSIQASLNNLISDVIIELERDEEEYLKLITLPKLIDDTQDQYNLPSETFKRALDLTQKLFLLYGRKDGVLFFKDLNGLRRFMLLMNTNSAAFALELVHDLIEKNNSCEYLLRLSLIFFQFFDYDNTLFCIKKGIDIAKKKNDIKYNIKFETQLLIISYILEENDLDKQIKQFFKNFKIKQIKNNLSELECVSLLNLIAKFTIDYNLENANLLFNYIRGYIKSIEESYYKAWLKSAVLNNHSDVFSRKSQIKKSLELLHLSLLINLKNSQNENAARKCNKISESYYMDQNYIKGYFYAIKGLKLLDYVKIFDKRLKVNLNFSLFINLIELEPEREDLDLAFKNLIDLIEKNFCYDFTIHYFQIIESYFYKVNDISKGLDFINNKIGMISKLKNFRNKNKYLNHVILLNLTFKYNLGQLDFEYFEKISDVTQIFKNGFQDDTNLFYKFKLFTRELDEMFSKSTISRNTINLPIKQFFYYNILKNFNKLHE